VREISFVCLPNPAGLTAHFVRKILMTVLHFHSVAAKPQDAYNLLDLKHDWFDKVS